jgi:PEGA domain
MRFPRITISVLAVSLLVPSFSFGQDKPAAPQQPTIAAQGSAPPAARPPLEFGLAEDTPVRLKLTRMMSSKDAKVDEKVDFEVIEDVKIGDTIVIQRGGLAIATVTEARPRRRLGRSGKLNMNIDYVQLVTGDKVPLHAVQGGTGGTRTAAMTGAMVATGIVFFPAAPLFLFMKGKNIEIPKGTEITAYIAADTPLDPARFVAKATTPQATTETGVSSTATEGSIVIKSDPEAAEITINGKFVGTTPSTIQLAPGDHTVLIEKAGFRSWQKTISVTAGSSATLSATLDRNP